MKRINWIGFLFLLLAIPSSTMAAELGNITIPVDGVLGGRQVQSGVYALNIDETSDRPYLQLSKNGNLIATDLVIVLPARGDGKTSVQITKVAGKEFIRIRARHEDQWFFAYLEKAL
ncbi:hypothetical protein L0222_14035 [bacterium]|nr:hypothetical protein [bacterium]MCI0604665.1 hypothetical protein [bacterium]